MEVVSKVTDNGDIFSEDALIGIPIELDLLKQTHRFQRILVALGRNAFC